MPPSPGNTYLPAPKLPIGRLQLCCGSGIFKTSGFVVGGDALGLGTHHSSGFSTKDQLSIVYHTLVATLVLPWFTGLPVYKLMYKFLMRQFMSTLQSRS